MNKDLSLLAALFFHKLMLRHEKKKHNVSFFFPLHGRIIYQKSPLLALSILANFTNPLHILHSSPSAPRDRCDFFPPQRMSPHICILYMQVARARMSKSCSGSYASFSTARTHAYLLEGAKGLSMHRRSALDNRALLSIFQPARAFREIDISRLHPCHHCKRRIFVEFSARNNEIPPFSAAKLSWLMIIINNNDSDKRNNKFVTRKTRAHRIARTKDWKTSISFSIYRILMKFT